MTLAHSHIERAHIGRGGRHHGERAEFRFYFIALYPIALVGALLRRMSPRGRTARAESVFGEASSVAGSIAGLAFKGW